MGRDTARGSDPRLGDWKLWRVDRERRKKIPEVGLPAGRRGEEESSGQGRGVRVAAGGHRGWVRVAGLPAGGYGSGG